MQRSYRTPAWCLFAAALIALANVQPSVAQLLPSTRGAGGSVCVTLAGKRPDTQLILVRLSAAGAATLGKDGGAADLMAALSDPQGVVEAIGRGALEHCAAPVGTERVTLAAFSVDSGVVAFTGTTGLTITSVRPIANPIGGMPVKWGGSKMPIGVNVDIPGRSDTSFPFKELMIQADFWTFINYGTNAGKLVPESDALVPVYDNYNDPRWQMPDFSRFAAVNPDYRECAAVLTIVRCGDVDFPACAEIPSGRYVITWDGQHRDGAPLSAIQMGHLGNSGGVVTGRFTPYANAVQVTPNRIELTLFNQGEAPLPGGAEYKGALVLKVLSSRDTDPVRNIHVWLPGMEGAAPTDMITPWMVANCRQAHCVRFLNWIEHWNKPCAYNDPPAALTPWSMRNYAGAPFQMRRDRVAIEHMAELCRKARADLWIPFHLGTLCDNGAGCDGRARVLGTMQILNANLHPGGRIYVELGNELWNNGYFTVQGEAVERLRHGDVMLDGSPGAEWPDNAAHPAAGTFGTYRAMGRSASILWEWCREGLTTPVFEARVERVLAGATIFYSTGDARITAALNDPGTPGYVPSVYVDPTFQTANRRTVNDIDVLAAGGYMAATGTTPVPGAGMNLNQLGASATAQQVLEAMRSKRLARLANDDAWKDGAAAFGKPYVNYEAGQHVVDEGHAWKVANDAAQIGDVNADATSPLSMEGEYYANLDQLRAPSTTLGKPGVKLSLQYTLRSRQTGVASGTWGLAGDFRSSAAASPKLRAIQRWGAMP